jgi:hypothetical protein
MFVIGLSRRERIWSAASITLLFGASALLL